MKNHSFDTGNLSLHQFSPKLYCFVSTRSQALIARLRGLKDPHVRFEEVGGDSEFKTFILENPAGFRNEIIMCFYINDQADYDLQRISTQLLEGQFARDSLGDSLVSLSCADGKRFACISDFWGITTHYWHESPDTFACGSNIMLIANIAGRELSQESLYEHLFFSWPRKEHTWFKSISCLRPGQQLVFDLASRATKLSAGTNFEDFLEPASRDLIAAVETFFHRANHRIGPDVRNYLTLSAGSDSRTVLACLRAYRMHPHAVSFGAYNMIETRAILNLTHRLHIPWVYVDMEGFEEKFEELCIEGTFYSSGLLNPMRTHYVWMYNHIRRGNVLFEGILGSEFAKGEIAVPALASAPYHDVIARGASVAASIDRHYPQLPKEFRVMMADYIASEFGAEMLDVNSSEGERAFQLYLLENIPSKAFSAVISIVKANSLAPYYPFLSPSIIHAVFNNDAGMRKSLSVRKDFIGPIQCLKAEAQIVRRMDEEIFESRLDRNVSFRDVLSDERAAGVQKRARDMRQRIASRRLMSGQIDVSKLIATLRDHVSDSRVDILPIKRSDAVANDLLLRASINYSCVCGIADTILK